MTNKNTQPTWEDYQSMMRGTTAPSPLRLKVLQKAEQLRASDEARFSPTGVPQAKSSHPRSIFMKRGAVVAAAALSLALISGVAFATTHLLPMQQGDAPFFSSGKNLPIYNNMESGTASLSANVGQTVDVEGVQVTLDSVSSDRNLVNLFFTMEKEGGFDLSGQSIYKNSKENEWVRLQKLVPHYSFTLTSGTDTLDTGSVHILDAYSQDGKIKCMERIAPKTVLPDQVTIGLKGSAPWHQGGQVDDAFALEADLDLSTVKQPRDLGSQDVVFATSQGDKKMGIKRFTTSELGTVMVVRNDETKTVEEGGRPMYRETDGTLVPQNLKMTDDQGNDLTPVDAGDGVGIDPSADYVVELAGMSPDAQSVTLTPVLNTVDWGSLSIGERQALGDENEREVDISQIGTKIPTSEMGGYELTGVDVANGTVSISLKPYGWHSTRGFELYSTEEPSVLHEEFTDPETGEVYGGDHVAVSYKKYDYMTGNIILMTSYYAAGDDELRGLTKYRYFSSFGQFAEEDNAAISLPFSTNEN